MKKHQSIWKVFLLILAATALLTATALTQPSFAANAKTDYDFTGIYLTRDSVRIKEGGSFTLTTRVIGTLEGEIAFSIADESIASVSAKGEVVAKKLGETVLTVTKGNYCDTCKIIVTDLDPSREEFAHTADLYRDFLDMRFGMFLHFNSSTYEFADIGGDWAGEERTSTFNPTSWNPSNMNCRDWAKAAKSAGMTFAVLTTKHHDGFDIWNSAYTDYDVGSATYQNDVVKEFTDACREEGIKPGLYFSMLDIKHKITSKTCTPTDIEFIKAQLTELLTNYGEIPFIIFDAWNAWWGGPNYDKLPYEEIVNLVHTIQPNCLVINISCEANNVRSEVAMFESAAGQNVPEWFDNINISCNTPTSHWFWCTKYNGETFKTADWVVEENLDKFRDSDTVFILNVSPNQRGVLIPKYTKLLSEIGARYVKTEDVEEFPNRYLADYDYRENLLFHKRTRSMTHEGNAIADRALDGFCDFDVTHETAFQAPSGGVWLADIGYTEKAGKLYIHLSSNMSKAAEDYAHIFLLDKDPGVLTSYNKLNNRNYVKKIKLSDCEKVENCYIADLGGAEGRYLAIAVERSSSMSFSEVVLNKAGEKSDAAFSLRDKFSVVMHTAGSEVALPNEAIFVTKNGGLVKETLTWNTASVDFTKPGLISVTGVSASGCEVVVKVRITSAGGYAEVPSVGVQASSMWSQAEQLGWAHSRNLIDKSGLTLNAANIMLSTHDNPYNGTSMWHTLEGQRTGWLIFDLGKVSTVTNALIYNHNQLNEPDRGVKRMAVYYTDKASPAASDWKLVGNYQLTKAGAIEAQGPTDFLSLGKLEARKIKFEILENYGDPSVVGLSEVIFFVSDDQSPLNTVAANAALTAFEMLNSYEYEKSAYSAAKTAYLSLVEGKKSANTQAALDSLTESLEGEIEAVKKTYQKKTPKDTDKYILTLKDKKLPETLTVAFTNGTSSELAVEWDAVPSEKLATNGCFILRGTIQGSTTLVTATVRVDGVSDGALKGAVAGSEVLDTSRYTAESVKVFADALAAAKTALAKNDATNEELTEAKAALYAAKYALKVDYAKLNGDTPIVTPPITETPTTTDIPSNGGDKDGENSGSYLIIIIVAIVVAFGAGIGITVLVMKKRG